MAVTAPGKKVIYGDLSADEIRALFEQFKQQYRGGNYSTAAEEAERFGVFKTNLKHIDALNKRNPLALFGVTKAADRTEAERARKRMGGDVASWAGLKTPAKSCTQCMRRAQTVSEAALSCISRR